MKEFNVSTNIIRDQNTDLNYIATKNAADIYNRIASNYKHNNKFQAIIGSYGTGKSSFLWAFEKNLLGDKNYFNSIKNTYPEVKSFQFIKLIGEYKPLSESIAKVLNIVTDVDNIGDLVLEKLNEIVTKNSEKKIVTVLLLDEFGKFLEYAVKNNPDKEVYYIQQLAEFFNDPKKLALSISSLHQNFSSYGHSLNSEQFKEWEKVKGRLKEVAFNEPIDQLLYFASERNQFKGLKLDKKYKELFKLIKDHNVSDKKQTIDLALAEKLLPLDYISAEIMSKSLQRYGQNERSLFTFLDVNESYSFKWFFNKNQVNSTKYSIYNLNLVFEYILEHYYFVISSNLNSDLTLWNSIKSALDQVDTRLDKELIAGGREIIKTIGLLNIFTHSGAKIDEEFIKLYATLALNIRNADEILKKLISQKIISYKKHKSRFVFVDWTDLDIDFEIQKASQRIQEIHNVAERISELDEFHPILVKSEYFRTGCPRLFEYKFTNDPISLVPKESDAIINYVFSEDNIKIINTNLPIIYAVFKNTDKIKSLFFEIDKAKKVKEENREDRSAVKELEERIFYSTEQLKSILVDEIYSNNDVVWYYAGEQVIINNRLQLNNILNNILAVNYNLSPIFKSELVNKSKLSTPISTARKNLITELIFNSDKENLGFPEDRFPPEKTIFLSLIKSIGIHRFNVATETYELCDPDFENGNNLVQSYRTLWVISTDFLEKSKTGKKNIKDLVDTLANPPLKLKQGFIDFWIPIFLILKKDDYALFNENGYIPNIDAEVFDVIYKSPQKFWVKAFDLSGIKLEVFNRYKTILNRAKTEKPSEKDFINTIKPFIVFGRTLNLYSSNTKNLTAQSIELREAIKNAKDPEKAFFEEFPKALNYSEALQNGDENMLKGFVEKMEASINEIRLSYEELLNRFENTITKTLSNKKLEFHDYKKILGKRLITIDASLLNSRLRNIQRKCINLTTDRKIFIEGIAYAVLGKGLDEIKDEEEQILHKDFITNYKHLLELVDIHELKKNHKNDDVFGIKILNEKGHEYKHQIVIPSHLISKVKEEVEKINKSFNGIDNTLKKAVLIELLKKEMNE